MSVIVELSISPQEFELGEILGMHDDAQISLETMVPLGDRTVPFFNIKDGGLDFEKAVGRHTSVDNIKLISSNNEESLYSLDWDVSKDDFFHGILENSGFIMKADGSPDKWEFNIRFPSDKELSEFDQYLKDNELEITIRRIYHPVSPDVGRWYGLTSPQREILDSAVNKGYYSIPREVSTKELSEEFEISDQAAIERLRRSISSLVQNTILTDEDE